MEKLIELLNEYEEKYRDFHFVGEDVREFTEFEIAFIISKKFGFIKWLVENEKIDLDRIPAIADNGATNIVLMLLSIQDEPIEFLISIIK